LFDLTACCIEALHSDCETSVHIPVNGVMSVHWQDKSMAASYSIQQKITAFVGAYRLWFQSQSQSRNVSMSHLSFVWTKIVN